MLHGTVLTTDEEARPDSRRDDEFIRIGGIFPWHMACFSSVYDIRGVAAIWNQRDEVSQWLSKCLNSSIGKRFAFWPRWPSGSHFSI